MATTLAASQPEKEVEMQPRVMLVGFQDQGNLGIGYLAATLEQCGYPVTVVDFQQGPERILEVARQERPILIGLSLIFQYYLPGFAELAAHLRSGGFRFHLTIGGHYPSLCYSDTLNAIPELDTVVRFEGEATLAELVERLASGRDWRTVQGIVYREGQELITTPLRPVLQDLDELPYPRRSGEPESILGMKALPILGSRGCAYGCSFCSIHTFYRSAGGKVVRVRNPAKIVEEMRTLYDERGVSIFLFQDDDFPIFGVPGQRWAASLIEELHRHDLVGRVIWKISCRAEHVEADLFESLRDAGLYLVYLGLESGTDEGLSVLAKRTTVERSLRGVAILKRLNITIEYGFMLFHPASSFSSVRQDTAFLRRILGDGSAAATFCRMLPYGATPIRESLARQGRLRGDVASPDYDFLDPHLDGYFEWLSWAVSGWTRSGGVSHQLNWAWHEVAVIERLFLPVDDLEEYKGFLSSISKRSNELLFGIIEGSSVAWERGRGTLATGVNAEEVCGELLNDLLIGRNEFIAHSQDVLLSSLLRQQTAGVR